MSPFIGTDEERVIDPDTLTQLLEQQKADCLWYAYQNHDLRSSEQGEVRFLLVGKNATFRVAPARYPDTGFGLGWRFVLVGVVSFETGRIEDLPTDNE